MPRTFGQNTEQTNAAALPVLGKAAGATDDSIFASIDTAFDAPLRMAATATPNALLNFSSNAVVSSNGSDKLLAPIQNNVPTIPVSTINFQTGVTSGTAFTPSLSSNTITLPTSTVGQFIRVGFTVLSTGTIHALFSSAQASVGALANAGTLMDSTGTPLGYIDLEATASTAYKTAGSSTSIIENSVSGTARIHLFVGGGSGGGGSTFDPNTILVSSSGQVLVSSSGNVLIA